MLWLILFTHDDDPHFDSKLPGYPLTGFFPLPIPPGSLCAFAFRPFLPVWTGEVPFTPLMFLPIWTGVFVDSFFFLATRSFIPLTPLNPSDQKNLYLGEPNCFYLILLCFSPPLFVPFRNCVPFLPIKILAHCCSTPWSFLIICPVAGV